MPSGPGFLKKKVAPHTLPNIYRLHTRCVECVEVGGSLHMRGFYPVLNGDRVQATTCRTSRMQRAQNRNHTASFPCPANRSFVISTPDNLNFVLRWSSSSALTSRRRLVSYRNRRSNPTTGFAKRTMCKTSAEPYLDERPICRVAPWFVSSGSSQGAVPFSYRAHSWASPST